MDLRSSPARRPIVRVPAISILVNPPEFSTLAWEYSRVPLREVAREAILEKIMTVLADTLIPQVEAIIDRHYPNQERNR